MPDQSPITRPPLPDRVSRIGELATDIWWSWQPEARTSSGSSTSRRGGLRAQSGADAAARARSAAACRRDPEFLVCYDQAIKALDARATSKLLVAQRNGPARRRGIAYFSAEFALHQSLPIYAGGLGVLAGDHCKEASDLGVPLVGVGFMYPQGYFHQRVSTEGWQEERYERLNWADAPIEPAVTPDGKPCIIAVPLGDRTVLAAVWRVRVGHVRLYLLDTDLEENAPWDRELSARLYGGDRETRIQQEIILGIGGVRALRALGIDPAVWHLNEGHAGVRRAAAHPRAHRAGPVVRRGARRASARRTVFTTHTPVPAGHDAFPFHLVEKHLAGCWGDARRSPRGLPGARAATTTATARSST